MPSNELKVVITGESGQLKGALSDASGAVGAAASQIGSTFSSLQSSVASAMSSISGTTGEIKNAFSSLGSTAQSALSHVTEQLGEMPGAMGEMLSGVGGLIGALNPLTSVTKAAGEAFAALGLIFRSAANEEEKYVTSMMSLARAFGITVQEAQTVRQAMEEISAHFVTGEVSTESLMTAFKRFARQVTDNEAGLTALGLHLRDDVTGEMKNSFDVFMEAIEHMKTLEGETAKMGFAAKVFGRGMSVDMITVLEHLSKETLEEANRKLTESGRLIGPEMVAKVQASKEASLGLKDAWASLAATISTVAIPVFTTLKNMLTSIVEACNWVAKGIGTVMKALGESELAAAGYDASLMKVAEDSKAVADIMPKHERTGGEPEKITKPKAPKAPESRMTEWEADLREREILEKNFFNESKAAELAFWQDKLNAAKLTYGEYWAIMSKMYELEKGMARDAHAAELAELQAGMRDTKASWDYRILQAMEAVSLQVKTYGEDSEQYKKAVADKKKLMEEETKALQEEAAKRLDAEIKVNDEILKAAQKRSASLVSQGKITVQQQIALDEQYVNEHYTKEMQLRQEEAAGWDIGSEKYKEVLDKMKLAHQKYVDAIQADEDKVLQEVKKQHEKMASDIEGVFSGVTSIMNSTTDTWSTKMLKALQSITMGFINLAESIAKAIAKQMIYNALGWGNAGATGIAGKAMQGLGLTGKAGDATGAASLTGAATALTTAATTMTTEFTTMCSTVGTAFTTAATALTTAETAASAQLDVSGVTLDTSGAGLDAAAAALTAAASALMASGALGMIPMAEGGWDIPSAKGGWEIPSFAGGGIVGLLHGGEMVLPRDLSEGFRDMIRGAGAGGQRPAAPARGGTINIHANDSADVARYFKKNAAHLASALRGPIRNFHVSSMMRRAR